MPATLNQLVAVRSQLAVGLEKYYEALVNSRDRTPWFRSGGPIKATQIIIPARVRERRIGSPASDALEENETDQESWAVWSEELPRIRRAIVIGEPGIGKSFLADTTTVRLAQDSLERLRQQSVPLTDLDLPIHLSPADLAKPDLSPDMDSALLELLKRHFAISAPLEKWMRSKLRTDQCWLTLDALDKVGIHDRDQIKCRLMTFETQGWQCRIVACHNANYDRSLVSWSDATEYELLPFSLEEINQFIACWSLRIDSRVTALSRLLDLHFAFFKALRNPRIAALACLSNLPRARLVELYARLLRGLLSRAWSEKPLETANPRIDDLLILLSEVAWRLFKQRPSDNEFTSSELIKEFHATLSEREKLGLLHETPLPEHTAATLRDELLACGILVESGLSRGGETQLRFLDRTFLEYLTGHALAHKLILETSLQERAETESGERGGGDKIAEDMSVLEMIDGNALNPAWEQVIVFLAGVVSSGREVARSCSVLRYLLERLTDASRDDEYRHRLALSAQCLSEITNECLGYIPDISDKIVTEICDLWGRHCRTNTVASMWHLNRALAAVSEVLERSGSSLNEWLKIRIIRDSVTQFIIISQRSEMRSWVLRYLINGAAGVDRRCDPTERYWIYYALSEIGGEDARNALETGHKAEDDDWARQGTEEALARLSYTNNTSDSDLCPPT